MASSNTGVFLGGHRRRAVTTKPSRIGGTSVWMYSGSACGSRLFALVKVYLGSSTVRLCQEGGRALEGEYLFLFLFVLCLSFSFSFSLSLSLSLSLSFSLSLSLSPRPHPHHPSPPLT